MSPTRPSLLAAVILVAALAFTPVSAAADTATPTPTTSATPSDAPTPSPSDTATPPPTPTPAPPADDVAEPPHSDDDGHDHSGPTEPLTIEPWDEPMDFPTRPMARGLAVPIWHLPFEPGQRWSAGGPHRDSDGVAWGALDFSPGSSPNKRVVAVAEGRVYRVLCPNGWFLGVDHGGGWKSEYYHLAGAQEQLVGQWVPAGAYLGEAGNTLPCGGSSNGPHVHLSILYGDPPQPGAGQRPYYPVDGMRFGNYVVRNGAAVHQGTWQDLSGNVVFRNWGCCLTSTTPTPQRFAATPTPVVSGTPNVGDELTGTVPAWQPAATFTFQWLRDGVAIPGASSHAYTVTKDDRGAALSLSVTGSRADYWPATHRSNALRVPTPVTRVAGVDRFETASLISERTFPPGVDTVFLATGADFPDALAAAAAAQASSPVLLTMPESLPSSTTRELERLLPRRIVVVGGLPAISDSVVTAARSYARDVVRIGGVDRYETAALLSAETITAGAPIAYIATGANFPDAVSAAAPAATGGGPVLLTQRDGVPTSTLEELERLRPALVVIVGDGAAISDAAAAQVGSAVGSPVKRVAGPNRYETAAALTRSLATTQQERVLVASGELYPDALTGAAAAAALGFPLLITSQATLAAPTADIVTALAPAEVTLLGSPVAVSETVARRLAALAR